MQCPQCGEECTWTPTIGLNVSREAICYQCHWHEGEEVMFSMDNIISGHVYECHKGGRKFPCKVMDKNPKYELICWNLDTNREFVIPINEIGKCIKAKIDKLSEWRLHNG